MADCHIGGNYSDQRRVCRLGGLHAFPEGDVPALRLDGRKRFAGRCRLLKISFVVPIPGRRGRLKLRRQAMRVIVFVKATEDSEKAILPTQEALEAMGKFNDELQKAGILR